MRAGGVTGETPRWSECLRLLPTTYSFRPPVLATFRRLADSAPLVRQAFVLIRFR